MCWHTGDYATDIAPDVLAGQSTRRRYRSALLLAQLALGVRPDAALVSWSYSGTNSSLSLVGSF